MNTFDNNLVIQAGRNTAFGVFASAARVATRMVMTPVVIAYLGLSGYGVWAILIAVMSIMQMGVAGLRSAFQKYVAEATGSGDFDRVSRVLSTGYFFSFALYFFALLPVALFAGPLAGTLGVPAAFTAPAATALLALALAVNISNLGGVFESIIMGAQRIDLVRKLDVALMTAEAAGFVLALVAGGGLAAMALVLMLSQAARSLIYRRAALRLLPQVRISPALFSWAELRGLIRFAGSYQLLNVIAVVYINLLPLAVLKLFGAEAAGIYAICAKLVEAVALAPEALMLPLLSLGAFIHNEGRESAQMGRVLNKSLKATLTIALPLLAFVTFFGERIVFAWTGQQDSRLWSALALLSAIFLFRLAAKTNFVLYRSIGGASRDLVWQVLRLFAFAVLGMATVWSGMGFRGILAGAGGAELLGLCYMLSVMRGKVDGFDLHELGSTFAQLAGIVAVALALCLAASSLTLPGPVERSFAALQSGLGFVMFVALALPALWMTNYFSREERRMVSDSLALLFR